MIVLDANALIAIFNRENGAVNARRFLRQHRGETWIHAMNFYEVFYGYERDMGRDFAERIWANMDKAEIQVCNDLDRLWLRDASFIKSHHKMSFADSSAVALARRLNCAQVSTDHHELDAVKAAGVCDVLFIR